MTIPALLRSALYAPGANSAVLLKSARSAADVLIFDLEDAVAPESKTTARAAVSRALADPVVAARTVVVRVNAIGSPWCEDDVSAVAALRPAGILFPKINTPADVKLAEAMLSFYGVPRSTALWCMIETPQAILNAQAIGQLAQQPNARMTTWVLGTNDLIKEMRAQHTPLREGVVPMLAIALMAARACGLYVLDGVHNDIQDTTGFAATCAQGRQMGFDGRTLIHPAQIEACHHAYSPSAPEVEEARAVIEAFAQPENQGKGVLRVGGRMVELLHAQMARQTLAMHEAIARAQA
ncbi:HpcH/HpaI aldolase/citrate lyase family protein [Acidovorax cavernicola]|uniref:CoA ester lyase n=1 Tax=Acidovorax cavernicola TaxID=1675792 RepID=A0A9X8D897_9BURK|nr:CoA ester lyase [Acidovorax cavernicola]RIX83230.1 CoA ester lyase [Acidovorax cavernicola]